MGYMSGTRRYGNSNYANRSFGPKSVETGKKYNIQITETGRKRDGVARRQGFVIFKKWTNWTGCKGKDYISRTEIRYSKNCCIDIRRRE
jgi:predicted RNA-binding protein with TRAM domain